MARIEITTVVGCKNACAYCPQDKFVKSYAKRSNILQMSFDVYKTCLDKIPQNVQVDFTGMGEPWLNPECAKMIMYTHKKGHRIYVSTTLTGMSLSDVDLIESIPFKGFAIHLPSGEGREKIVIDENYIAVLKKIIRSKIGAGLHFHGQAVHPKVKLLVEENIKNILTSSRAGNVEAEKIPILHKKQGKLTCKRNCEHNVLLPNGDVILCCMDYGMRHILGNLLASDYNSLFRGKEFLRIREGLEAEDSDILCRYCDQYVVQIPRNQMLKGIFKKALSVINKLKRYFNVQKVIEMHLLQHILKLKYCKYGQDEGLLSYFKELTSTLKIHNVFNPSFYCDDDVKVFAFRAVPNGNDLLTSFISVEDKTGRTVRNISIDLYEELNGIRLIDPKITKINEDFYVTFNSGHIDEGNNIFIMKIYPKIEAPKRLIYRNRQKQERNWAFFYEKGEIYALYGVNPLKILKLKNTTPKSWEMEDFYCEEKQDNNIPCDLTIGTQLSDSDGKYYFIAHKKLYFLKKKIYLGKFCVLDFNKKTISSGKYWLVHSLKSLFGSTVKHNTNLLSCTYFSGIQALSGSIKLGYGINDVKYGFSMHKIEDL